MTTGKLSAWGPAARARLSAGASLAHPIVPDNLVQRALKLVICDEMTRFMIN
jgi:hypothetical protein